MSEEAEKAIRTITFSGKRQDWRMWSKKFMARAVIKNYVNVLKGTITAPRFDATIDVSTKDGKEQQKARNANEIAYSELLLSCDDEVYFEIVCESMTADLPEGCAKTALEQLISKYEPKDSTDLI